MSGKGVVGAALPRGELQLMKVPNYTGHFFSFPTCSQWDEELASKWRRAVGEAASQGEDPLQKGSGFPVNKINYSGLSVRLLWPAWWYEPEKGQGSGVALDLTSY